MHTLLTLLFSFGKIGLVSLGGGNSMLKLIEYEAVVLHHWISREEFVRMIGSSFLFPGLTVVKLSALIGYKTAGIAGLLLAVIALNLPGLLMATIGYGWLASHGTPAANKLMIIVQYGALALLSAATFSIAQDVLAVQRSIILVASCVLFFIALAFLNASPFWGFLIFIGVCFVAMP
jgi:chromate transporter